jgi:hypothetical protein
MDGNFICEYNWHFSTFLFTRTLLSLAPFLNFRGFCHNFGAIFSLQLTRGWPCCRPPSPGSRARTIPSSPRFPRPPSAARAKWTEVRGLPPPPPIFLILEDVSLYPPIRTPNFRHLPWSQGLGRQHSAFYTGPVPCFSCLYERWGGGGG